MGIKLTRLLIIVIAGIGMMFAASGPVSGQTPDGATPVATFSIPPLFDGEKAMDAAKAQIAIGFRPTGSLGGIKTGDYIITALKAAGWNVIIQPFTLKINGQDVQARNITGSIGTGSPILIGAHYDTRLWADKDPDPAKHHDPVMGADDGASGVAVELELARVLGKYTTYNHEIRLVFLDAEDNGVDYEHGGHIPGWDDWSLGTTYYVDHLDAAPAYVIILDMIGDKDLNIYYEGASMQSDPEVMIGMWNIAADLGYRSNFIPSIKYTMTDDHTPFITKKIPAVDIIDFDYPYHHTTSDTLDKISAESMEKVGRVVQKYLEYSGAVQ